MTLLWIKNWKNDLLGSLNFQQLSAGAKGFFSLLRDYVRDDQWCGGLCYPNGKPMTIWQLTQTIKGRFETIEKYIETLIDKGMLYYDKNGIICIRKYAQKVLVGDEKCRSCNKYNHAKKRCPFITDKPDLPLNLPCESVRVTTETTTELLQKPLQSYNRNHYRVTTTPTTEPTTAELPQLIDNKEASFVEEKRADKNKNDIYITDIFNHWNTKNIIKCPTLTNKLKDQITDCLTNHNRDQIIGAIDNYAIILGDHIKYYYSHRHSLESFLNNKPLGRFLTESKPFESLKRTDAKPETKDCPKCGGKGTHQIHRNGKEGKCEVCGGTGKVPV